MNIKNRELGKVMHLVPIILCGEEGSRLWPVSREMHPKLFIRLEDGYSLLQKAFLRGKNLPGVSEILTLTNREFFFKVEDEFREVNETAITTSFILEPLSRNIGASATLAALQIAKTYDRDTLMLVLSPDDLIYDQDAFQQAVSDASIFALKDKIVAFGISPNGTHPSKGYIEHEAEQVINFLDHLELEQTRKDLDPKRYLLNSGLFLFKAGTLLQLIEDHYPQTLDALKAWVEQSQYLSGKGFNRLDLELSHFSNTPDKSLEELLRVDPSRVAVICPHLAWASVNSWSSLSELIPADTKGNRIDGEAFLHEVKNCHIQSDSRLIGAVGVEDLFIVDTHDALLVANKANIEDIEQIYKQLKIQNHEAYKFHQTVHRPWGSFTTLEEGERFKIKRIEVKPGASLSLQMHHHRSEHWIVVSGTARVTNGEEIFFVKTNESTYIPAGHKHRLENPGILNLVMIEVQSGEYLGEDDIVRFQDNYGRI